MSDAKRAFLIICLGVTAWGAIDDWRLAGLVLVAAVAIAPWSGS